MQSANGNPWNERRMKRKKNYAKPIFVHFNVNILRENNEKNIETAKERDKLSISASLFFRMANFVLRTIQNALGNVIEFARTFKRSAS